MKTLRPIHTERIAGTNCYTFTYKDGATYSEEQLDVLMDMEKEWKATIPRYRFQQLFEVYPSAVPAAKRTLKSQLSEARFRADYPLIKKLSSQLAYLNELADVKKGKLPRINPTRITEDMIARAKEHPISDLIEVNRARKALCLFHQDRTPSMHIYDDLRYKCFVCQEFGDSISLYRALHPKATFPEAVRALI